MALQLQTIVFCSVVLFAACNPCKKETFQNTIVKLSLDEFGEFSKTDNITGCISPVLINSKVVVIECYNQSLRMLREGAVTDMPELKTMIFMDNSINKLAWATFTNLPNLEQLILSRNKIRLIDVGVFSVVPSVGLLQLEYNQIAFLGHGIFTNMPNLRILRLHHNELDTIEQEWFDLNSNLSIIDLSHNLIRRVSRTALQSTKSLEIIDLSNNRLLSIDEKAFEGLDTLFQLDLSENRLYQITGDVFVPLVKLDVLFLHGNNLTYIHDHVLGGITRTLREISIYSNPWQCGCYNNIMKWVNEQHPNVSIDSTRNCKIAYTLICAIPQDNPDDCLEDVDDELDSAFYEKFKPDSKSCQLELSHP